MEIRCARGEFAMVPHLPQVIAFNSEFCVERDGEFLLLRADVPDWAPISEIVHDLGVKYGAQTVNDLVVALDAEGRVERVIDPGDHVVFSANHKLN